MIIGLGSDICDIRRIERSIERFGQKFLNRVFTPAEIAKAERRSGTMRTGTYAKRFAAKEAMSKALGTGFRRGVFMSDLAVINLPGGKPSMQLSGGAALRLIELTPPGLRAQIDITLTDEYPYAFAQVIISALG